MAELFQFLNWPPIQFVMAFVLEKYNIDALIEQKIAVNHCQKFYTLRNMFTVYYGCLIAQIDDFLSSF